MRYGTLEEVGISDPDALTWHQMPDVPTEVRIGEAQDEDREGSGPLTIPEAKAGLALGLGVPESAIEINIRF